MQTVTSRLRYVMSELGIRQVDIARLTGVSAQVISYLLVNDVKKSYYSYQLAIGLGVNPEWLANGEGEVFTPSYTKLPYYASISDLKNHIPSLKKKTAVKKSNRAIYSFSLNLNDQYVIICGIAPESEIKVKEYFCLFDDHHFISTTEIDSKECLLCCQILEWRKSNLKPENTMQEVL